MQDMIYGVTSLKNKKSFSSDEFLIVLSILTNFSVKADSQGKKNDISGIFYDYLFLKKASYPIFVFTEAVVWRCSVKKVFLGISQNSQENTCARVSFLIKLQD